MCLLRLSDVVKQSELDEKRQHECLSGCCDKEFPLSRNEDD